MRQPGLFLRFLLIAAALSGTAAAQRPHPSLLITREDAAAMKAAADAYPLFTAARKEAEAVMMRAFAAPMDVPAPKDAGGYTHERHKQNYREMQAAGALYQVTGDERYALFVRDMLLKYAALYPTLERHPQALGRDGGRLFWQTLNETVWLVNAAQAYDCVYDRLTPADRTTIEKGVLRPIADFFISEQAEVIDRIHNHGTWMVASIGMLGYALRDQHLVDIALYGTKKDGTVGFLKQLDLLYSPDGYYTEGTYYARYAIQPFFLFAAAIENNQPGLRIFQRRDGILNKALRAVFNLSYTNGALIPINDALKEKTILSDELVSALDITFRMYGGDRTLLALANRQRAVTFDGAGLAVARALAEGGSIPEFPFASIELRDGAQGDEGAVGILRSGPQTDQSMLVMKYTAQGMGHGHYDKLTFLYYDQGREIIQDYGSARFINIEPKFGGRYLPENTSWAKQTIAHATVTVDGKSHFQGKYELAEKEHCDRRWFDASDPSFQTMSASSSTAYPGIVLQRTMALVRDERLSKPVVIDVFRVVAERAHRYDLPFYYMGQFITTNVSYSPFTRSLVPVDSTAGYRHLWKTAEGAATGAMRFTWLNGGRYYSLVSAADSTTRVLFTEIGAADPNFNLRREPGIMLRTRGTGVVFATVLEPHGLFEPVDEISTGANGVIRDVRVLASTEDGTVVRIEGPGLRWTLMVANGAPSADAHHALKAGEELFQWNGNAALRKEAAGQQ